MKKYLLHIIDDNADHTERNAVELMENLTKGYEIHTVFIHNNRKFYLLELPTTIQIAIEKKTLPPIEYKGDDQHLLVHEDGHMRIDCWCLPEIVHDGEDHYVLHRDENGKTLLNDSRLAN